MAEVERITRPVGLRRTALQRLALLVTGIIAAQSTVLAQVAAALFALDLTNAGKAESIGRRLRRALVTLCLGVQQAKDRLATLANRPTTDQPPKPHPPRESLFTLGLRAAQCWLAHKFSLHLHWPLPPLAAQSWHRQWLQAQADFFLFGTVRP
jgi:hypothetical protein